MAQTKRKRRTKHRGTAAGTIEARGRTGRKPTAKETPAKRGASGGRAAARPNKPPSWGSALGKAGFGAVMLFLLMQLGVLGGDAETGQALAVSGFALAAYTPVMYVTDRFIYQRRLRKERG
jgi:hypothetical protein